jgi:hypothetical protein
VICCKVSDQLYRQLQARFSREELVELCFLVSLAALVNRVHATFATGVDAVTRASGGAPGFVGSGAEPTRLINSRDQQELSFTCTPGM